MLRTKIKGGWAVLILVALVVSVSSVMAQEEEVEEKPWKGTWWLLLTYEFGSTKKTTYELDVPLFLALTGGRLLALSGRMNMYQKPVTLSPNKGTTYTFLGAAVVSAKVEEEEGGGSATLVGLQAGIGYRYHFSRNFHGRIGVSLWYFLGDVEGTAFNVLTFSPVISLGFSF